MQICVRKVAADLRELAAVKELVFLGKQEGSSDEILDSCDDGFAVSRGDKVMFNTHKFERFRSCFFGLGYICGND